MVGATFTCSVSGRRSSSVAPTTYQSPSESRAGRKLIPGCAYVVRFYTGLASFAGALLET